LYLPLAEAGPPQPNRASVLGEFGGAGFSIPGHLWNPQGQVSDAQEPWIFGRLETLRDLAAKGLSAAAYTQLSDVENEVNGFLTYDRTTVQKVDPDAVQRAVRKLYAP